MRPHETLATSHTRLRNKIEDVLMRHAQGMDSVIRPTNIPVKNGRPGIGRAKEQGFITLPTVLTLGRLDDKQGYYVNLAARVGYLGRPTSVLSDFGEPETGENARYRQLRVELCGQGAGETALYGLLLSEGHWVEITDLRRTEVVSNHAPDRELFMNSCLIPLSNGRHANKIKPYLYPVESVAVQTTITAVRSGASAV